MLVVARPPTLVGHGSTPRAVSDKDGRMAQRRLDEASTFTIRTRAEGMLSKLAHDLELVADGVTAEVDVDGETWRAGLVFPVDRIDVVGTLDGDRVDRGGLNRIERMEIKRRLRKEVLPDRTVRVVAEGSSFAEGKLTLLAPTGQHEVPLRELRVEAANGDQLVVEGRSFVSLRALGIKEIKGPLGAFKVSDAVELRFHVKLR